MKKIFAFLAIATMFAVACNKPANNTPADQQPEDQTPEDQYAGPVEGTSDWSVIGALLGTNWDKDYVMAASGDIFVLKDVKLAAADEFKIRFQKDWPVNRGGDYAELGKGFEVTNNGNNIKPGLDGNYDIYYNAAKEQMAVVAKDGTPTWSEGGEGGEETKGITIDGEFSDWAALKDGTYSKTFGDPESTHPALIKALVYADPDYIYVYFEWDTELIAHEGGVEHVPFHCYINTDGDESTGGFSDQFTDACIDILTEGWIYGGGETGDDIDSYDPGIYSWTGEPNGSGWSWSEHIFADGSGFGEGAGVEGKYEFKLDRSMLADADYPVADVFSIGFDIQQDWDSVGILPMMAPTEDNATGNLPSLKVVTQK